jgi:hypothetical protein
MQVLGRMMQTTQDPLQLTAESEKCKARYYYYVKDG